jgi:hypothetical protein
LPDALLALAVDADSVDGVDVEAAGAGAGVSDFVEASFEDVSLELASPLALAAGASEAPVSLGWERVSVE